MRIKPELKNIIIEIICILYIMLFVYAAVSKLLDFKSFQVQLGQSPLLSSFAEYLSYLVPLIELILAVLLVFNTTRIIALFGCFTLMMLFTNYIFFILNFASYVPCSCGGILEKMGWKSHFIFNLFFVLLAIGAIVLLKEKHRSNGNYNPISKKKKSLDFFFFLEKKKMIIVLCALVLSSITAVFILFKLSEHIIHNRNSFIRRFPPHPITKAYEKNLEFNSYYFAGSGLNKIFLANKTAPLLVMVLDETLKKQEDYTIKLNEYGLPFKSILVKVADNNFYVFDGTVSCIFKGKISDWKADLAVKDKRYFSMPSVIDSNTVAVRSLNYRTMENELGKIRFKDSYQYQYSSKLLEKQIDGFFDTDGMLLYDDKSKKLVYVYYYRNQYIVADKDLNLEFRGNTIDTNKRAKIDVVYLNNHKISKLAKPPLFVNSYCTSFKNLLFVKSDILGRFESTAVWEKASIIDVYNLSDRSYRFSFYIYSENGFKVNQFVITDNYLYALIDKKIVAYKLNALFK